jgi:hypothetical protein
MLQPKFSAAVDDDDNRDILPVIATQCKKAQGISTIIELQKGWSWLLCIQHPTV